MLEIRLPNIDVNDQLIQIRALYAEDGGLVRQDMPLVEMETAKVTQTLHAPQTGIVKFYRAVGESVPTGSVVCAIFDTKEEYESSVRSCRDMNVPADPILLGNPNVRATKKALEKARELGISVESINKADVITRQDVLDFFENLKGKAGRKDPVFSYDRERVVIIGGGKGAEAVLDILLDDRDKYVVGFVDDARDTFAYFNLPSLGRSIRDFPQAADRGAFDSVIISLGANLKSMQLRKRIFEQYSEQGITFTNAVSKSAEIRRFTRLGAGNIIGAGVYIGTATVIGNNNSVSYGAKIGHHNVIGDHNLLGPAAALSGSVTVGSGCIVSAGVSFINRVSIGDNVILPVNYAVTGNLPPNTLIRG